MISPSEQFFFKTYVEEIGRLRQFLDLTLYGLDAATDHADIGNLIYPYLDKSAGAPPGTFGGLLPEARVREFAKSEKSSGFPFLYHLLVIRLWSILETVVDQAVLLILSKKSASELPDEIRSLKAPIFEFLASPEEARADFLLDCIKQSTKASLKPGVGRFEALLGAVGFSKGIDDRIRRNILELSEVRNVVVHRSGVADDKFLRRCPWFGGAIGKQLQVSRAEFGRYASSVDWYTFDIADRILDILDGPSTPERMRDHHHTLDLRKAEFLRHASGAVSADGDPAPAVVPEG